MTDSSASGNAKVRHTPISSNLPAGSFTRGIVWSGLAVILIAGALLAFFWTQFETNDDAAMNMYAGGFGLVSHPSEYLLFINVGLGLILKALYQHIPLVPWYGVLEFRILSLAAVLVCAVLFDAVEQAGQKRWLGILIAASWVIIFSGNAFVSPQFTIIAAYSSGAGIILLCLGLDSANGHLTNKQTALAWLAIILGGMLRIHSACMAVLVLFPLLFFTAVKGTSLSTIVKRSLFLLLPLLMSGVFEAGDQAYYKSEARWASFREHNYLKSNFTDRQLEDSPEALAAVGWSKNDLLMLKKFLADPEIYSAAKLREFSARSDFQFEHQSVAELIRPGRALFESKRFLLLIWAAAAFGIVSIGLFGLRTGGIVKQFSALLWAVAVLGMLSVLDGKPPFRIWYPVLGLASVQFFVLSRLEPVRSWVFRPVLLAALAGLAVLSAETLRELDDLSDRHRKQQAAAAGDLERITAVHHAAPIDRLYVVWSDSFPFEPTVLPLRRSSLSDAGLNLLAIGVGTQQPHVQDRLKEFGITDLYRALFSDTRVFMIVSSPELIALFKIYVSEHYNVDVTEQLIFEGTMFKVYQYSGKVRSAEAPEE